MGQVCKESDIKEGSITEIKALSQQDSFEAVTTPSDINRAEDSFQDFKGSSSNRRAIQTSTTSATPTISSGSGTSTGRSTTWGTGKTAR